MFIEVPLKQGFKVRKGDHFEECKTIIHEEANNGCRVNQVVIPPTDHSGEYFSYCYQIIFEKKIG